jgi:hypothetical protein
MGVFVTYTAVFLTLLRNLILREDFGSGPLPGLATVEHRLASRSSKAGAR